MARSDEPFPTRRLRLGLLLALGAALVSGCSTTQDEAARLQLNSARIRASEVRTVVKAAGHAVRVERVSLVAGRGQGPSAIVVQLRNPGAQAVGDLPIAVGVRTRGRGRVPLNVHSPSSLTAYFDAHLPVIAPGQSLDWVYTTTRALGRDPRPYALVGDRPNPPLTHAGIGGTGPVISAQVLSLHRARGGETRLVVSLHNTTTVPQYQLLVTAVARRGSRVVAAGTVTVPHLGSHRTETYPLDVIGSLAHAQLELAAIPTIFH